jgi:hypothetical protein
MINSGTKKAQKYENYGYNQEFFDNAYIPLTNWRQPTDSEMEIICNTNYSSNPLVQVLRLPDVVTNCLNDLQTQIIGLQTQQVLKMVHSLNSQLQQQTKIWDYINSIHYGLTQEIKVLGLGAMDPGKITVSYDSKSGRHVGLHFDSFSGDDILHREQSPNRLCINIGTEVRYLMFINLTASQIYHLLNQPSINNVNTLLRTFLQQYPQYPVLRIKIHPGEAYIAPTEAIIHDGTTLEKTHVDVSFTVLGRFMVQE